MIVNKSVSTAKMFTNAFPSKVNDVRKGRKPGIILQTIYSKYGNSPKQLVLKKCTNCNCARVKCNAHKHQNCFPAYIYILQDLTPFSYIQ